MKDMPSELGLEDLINDFEISSYCVLSWEQKKNQGMFYFGMYTGVKLVVTAYIWGNFIIFFMCFWRNWKGISILWSNFSREEVSVSILFHLLFISSFFRCSLMKIITKKSGKRKLCVREHNFKYHVFCLISGSKRKSTKCSSAEKTRGKFHTTFQQTHPFHV